MSQGRSARSGVRPSAEVTAEPVVDPGEASVVDPAEASVVDPAGTSVVDAGDGSGRAGDLDVVTAAGVVCWRESGYELEVLLVHRPAYDDWSFPKGKQHGGELLPQCALRELAEETGVEAVLGRPLPGTQYLLPTGQLKQVSYWVGRPRRTARATASAAEVDQTRWVGLDQARELLTSALDRVPLDTLAGWARDGVLETTPVIVVRHSAARPRDAWPRPDAERPLVAAGRRQAVAVGALLHCWRPDYLLSSPWLRCLETLAPYAQEFGLRVRTKGGLTESGYRRNPDRARRHLERLIQRGKSAALCTHRPVLLGLLAAVAAAQRHGAGPVAPTSRGLAPGEILVIHVVHGAAGGSIVATERFLARG